MDKSDIALIISALSALFALLSALYSRKMALNDAERMKRKPLVLEISSSPCQEYRGWHSVLATIRNFEPVAARVHRIRLKRGRRLKLLPQAASFGDGPEYNPGRVNSLPTDQAKDFINLDYGINAQGPVSDLLGSGPMQHIQFYSTGNLKASDLLLDWEWADGTKQ